MCGFTVTAHAGGGDEYIEPTDQWEGLEEPTPLPSRGWAFLTRATLSPAICSMTQAHQQAVITVQTSGGNTFYIVSDYDKPVDEGRRTVRNILFSIVDEADLLAAMEAAGMVPACALYG